MKNPLSFMLFLWSMLSFSQCYDVVESRIYSTIAIRSDGTLWSWGRNDSGNLGLGTGPETFSTIYPPTQIEADSDWQKISNATPGHVLAIKDDGSLWAWGRNINGECGIGTMGLENYVLSPHFVDSGIWTDVAAGTTHTLAVKSDGTLWAWGDNGVGQLGNGNLAIVNETVPVQVGSANDCAKVYSNHDNSFAIKTDGTLWSWGTNSYNVLGYNGSPSDNLSPHQVGTDSWLMVSAPLIFSVIGIKSDGTLWGWGRNPEPPVVNIYYGNGNPDSNNYENGPVQIGTDSNWADVTHHGNLNTLLTKPMVHYGVSATTLQVSSAADIPVSNIRLSNWVPIVIGHQSA